MSSARPAPTGPGSRGEIIAPDYAARFGYAVSLDNTGNVLAVGDYGLDEGRGIAHVYRYDGSAWDLQAQLVPDERHEDGHFGDGVAVSDDGTRFVVGESGSGVVSALVFDLVTADLSAPSGAAGRRRDDDWSDHGLGELDLPRRRRRCPGAPVPGHGDARRDARWSCTRRRR